MEEKKNLFVPGVELFRNVSLLVHGDCVEDNSEREEKFNKARERKMKIEGQMGLFYTLYLSSLPL